MSSFAPPRYTKSLLAAVDLSAKQFYYVGEDGSGTYNVAGAATGALGAGFLMNAPLAGEACNVASIGGGAKGVLSGTVTIEMELKATTGGTLVEAGTAGDIVVALAKSAGVTGDIIDIEPVYYRKHA
jgi:hypothetical protein